MNRQYGWKLLPYVQMMQKMLCYLLCAQDSILHLLLCNCRVLSQYVHDMTRGNLDLNPGSIRQITRRRFCRVHNSLPSSVSPGRLQEDHAHFTTPIASPDGTAFCRSLHSATFGSISENALSSSSLYPRCQDNRCRHRPENLAGTSRWHDEPSNSASIQA